MTVLTPTQIAGYLTAAGLSGSDVVTGTAIALAESGGNTQAHNSNAATGDDSYGFMQINMLGALGPARRAKYGLSANEDLYDPATNARVAVAIFKDSGWAPWSSFKSGAYKTHLKDAGAPTVSAIQAFLIGIGLSNPSLGGATNVAGGAISTVTDAASAIPNAINGFSQTIFTAFQDVAGIIAGIALLVIGLLIINRQHISKVKGAATKVAEVAAL